MKKVQVTNTDVAKAISGTIESNKLYPFMHRGVAPDVDAAVEDEIYDVTSEWSSNQPSELYKYGTLIVCGSIFKMQLYAPHREQSDIYRFALRVMYKDVWSVWRYFKEDK